MLNRVVPVFFLIVCLTLALWGWILYRNRDWQKLGQRALILIHPATGEITTPLTVAVWHPDQREVLLLPLPDEMQFQASHNGERYSISSLPRLAEIENWSDVRWRRELSLQLGIIFDGSMWVSLPQDGFDLNELKQESWQALLGQRQSTLAPWDNLSWWQGMQQADDLRSQVFEFDRAWLGPDKTLNQSVYDRFARLRLQDETIRNSQWTLRVVNASGRSGEAGRQARMLELIGFGVRSVETQTEQSTSGVTTLPESDEFAQEERWARVRFQQLYVDWEQQENQKLFEQQRVQGEVVVGE